MANRDQSTGELAREAVESTKKLVQAEAKLAAEDMKRTAFEESGAFAVIGAGAIAGFAGLELVVIAFAQATRRHPGVSFALGLGLLDAGALATAAGLSALPKRPLASTRSRLEHDVDTMREAV